MLTEPANIINGTSGDDTLNGTAEFDIINGLAGNDYIGGGGGGGGGDHINGGDGNDVISVTAGDQIWGDAGNDSFLIWSSYDGAVINDFTEGDTINLLYLDDPVYNFLELMSHASQSGTDVLLDFSGGEVTLYDTLLSDLEVDDFVYSSDFDFVDISFDLTF